MWIELDERLFDPGLKEAGSTGSSGLVQNLEERAANKAGIIKQVESCHSSVVNPHKICRINWLHPEHPAFSICVQAKIFQQHSTYATANRIFGECQQICFGTADTLHVCLGHGDKLCGRLVGDENPVSFQESFKFLHEWRLILVLGYDDLARLDLYNDSLKVEQSFRISKLAYLEFYKQSRTAYKV